MLCMQAITKNNTLKRNNVIMADARFSRVSFFISLQQTKDSFITLHQDL